MSDNILYAGAEELKELKRRIEVQEESKARVEELEAEQLNLSKAIDTAKRAMNEEIEATVKERRAAVEAGFKEQMDSVEREVKKIQSAKSKEKQEKVAEKVSNETEEYYDKIQSIKKDIRDYAREKKLPLLAKQSVYYSIFCPRTVWQFFATTMVFLVFFAGVPLCLRYFLRNTTFGQWAYYSDAIYLICILLFGGIVLWINRNVRDKYREDIDHVLELRADIRATKRKINRIKKGIERDKDESQYGLDNYDNELSEMEAKLKGLTEDQNKALEEFSKVTRLHLVDEISNRHEVDLKRLQADFDSATAELKELSEKIRVEAIELTKNYESTIGKAYLKLETIERMIELIQMGTAQNVSEALMIVKNESERP